MKKIEEVKRRKHKKEINVEKGEIVFSKKN